MSAAPRVTGAMKMLETTVLMVDSGRFWRSEVEELSRRESPLQQEEAEVTRHVEMPAFTPEDVS